MNQQFNIPEKYNMADDIDRHAVNPEKTAVLWEDAAGKSGSMTYAELKQRSDRLARGFIQVGLTRGSKLLVILPRGPEAYVIYLAALKAGFTVMPGS